MKILITAFDPFGGDEINPALEAVKLMKSEISGARIVKLEVPTLFNKSIDKVVEAIEKENPDVVLNIGQAGGRFDITPERVAINSAIAYGYAKKDFAKLYIMNSGNKLGIPCMICRQTFVELLPDDIEIIMYNDSLDKKTYTKVELCPLPFSKGDLE